MNPYDSITCTGSMGMISARSFREGFCEHPSYSAAKIGIKVLINITVNSKSDFYRY